MENNGRLVIVRHGQTSANVDGIWHGSTDTPLTDLGRDQARKLGTHFHHIMAPHAIYASPLQRARDTAEAIARAHQLDVVVEPRLSEFCLGDWEGLKFAAIEQNDPGGRLYSDPDFAPPNGESQNRVRQRVVQAMEEILARHPGRNVVMVSHGVALGIALSHYLHGHPARWMEYSHRNTGYSEFCPRARRLLSFNQTAHYDTV